MYFLVIKILKTHTQLNYKYRNCTFYFKPIFILIGRVFAGGLPLIFISFEEITNNFNSTFIPQKNCNECDVT